MKQFIPGIAESDKRVEIIWSQKDDFIIDVLDKQFPQQVMAAVTVTAMAVVMATVTVMGMATGTTLPSTPATTALFPS